MQFAIQGFNHGEMRPASRSLRISDLVSYPIPYVRIEELPGHKPLVVIIKVDKEQIENAVGRDTATLQKLVDDFATLLRYISCCFPATSFDIGRYVTRLYMQTGLIPPDTEESDTTSHVRRPRINREPLSDSEVQKVRDSWHSMRQATRDRLTELGRVVSFLRYDQEMKLSEIKDMIFAEYPHLPCSEDKIRFALKAHKAGLIDNHAPG